MSRYRKKPIIIEAFLMTIAHRWDNSEWPEWLDEAWQKDIEEEGSVWTGDDEYLFCTTLEGVARIDWDDWIIQGVAGEIYPCKPHIFEATYDLIED